ncbi:PAS domain-containing sensor histidine kinase [Caldalkalibacillus salinus]|uniref:PAS domain-containing sensor histidine kinase n=1 Tax=Caldalkalibacillus salinus TaxID=2803787 RepID=UPI001923150D|nr:ATP-binding protein [Caldalkalibacillus salinus]
MRGEGDMSHSYDSDPVAQELKQTIQILPNSIFKCKLSDKGTPMMTFHEGALAEEFQLTTEKVQGQFINTVLNKRVLAQWKDAFTRVFEGDTVDFEFKYANRVFHTFAKPVKEEHQGQTIVKEVVGFVSDITRQKQDRDRLRESEEQLRTLINAIPDVVFLKDGEGRWLETNHKALHFFKLEDVDYRGKKDDQLAHHSQDYAEALRTCIDSDELAWQQGVPTRVEEVINQPDGTSSIFDVVKVPIYYTSGERKGLVVVGRDITDRMMAEEALRKAETMNVVGELAAGVAHEIRNPLTALKGFVQLLEINQDQMDQRYLDIMHSEIERIEFIINEFLVLAKPQSLSYEKLSIATLVNNTVTLFETQAILSNVQIFVESESELPLVYGEQSQLRQVFLNLLKNATEAMPQGGSIHIKMTHPHTDWVQISFIDSGIGIPPERIKRLGEPYYTTKEKGTGLGLMVSYKIIKNHQGTINVESELNKGTKFDIHLPSADHDI